MAELTYRGKTEEELKSMSIEEFAQLVDSRTRRRLMRLSDDDKKFIEKIKKKDVVKTHYRDFPVIPAMLGKTIKVHNGKEFVDVKPTVEMLGHRLGEFALTRKRVIHSVGGLGSSKSKRPPKK